MTSRLAMYRGPSAIAAVALALMLAAAGCTRSETAPPASAASAPVAAAEPVHDTRSPADRDLSADEAMGGHTLSRHVGKNDDELRARLRREPDISSASTYTDRATAEAVVGAALSSGGRSFSAWQNRSGRRPNFVLHYGARRPIGRSVARGGRDAVSCENALVVVRWDDRQQRFYVLTSYPEVRR